jgi:biopolymer transport protein ExbD
MATSTSSASAPRAIITGINVTPLVDVVLVLLVILMVTATEVVRQSLPLDLPEAESGVALDAPLEIAIARDGSVFLGEDAVTLEELRARVSSSASPRDVRAMVAADADTPHRALIEVLDALRLEGVERYALHVRRAAR